MTPRFVTTLALVGLVVGACAGQANVPIAELDTTSTTQPASNPASVEPTTTTSAEPGSTSTTGPIELAGEEIDLGIRENAELTPVRVAHDDVLNLRAGPGIDAPVIFEIPPTRRVVHATGKARQLENNSIWFQLQIGDPPGWANARYLAFLGPSNRVTEEITEQLVELPADAALEDVARMIAELHASDDPPSEVVFSEFRGDFIVVDVIGLGDDSVLGYRFMITFNQGGGDLIELVVRVDLCARGLAIGDLCA